MSERRELAAKLKGLRRTRGRSSYQLARDVGFSQSKIMRIENGHSAPSPEDVDRIACCLDLNEDIRFSLVATAQSLEDRSRRHAAMAFTPRSVFELESSARSVYVMGWDILPGHVQTPDYMNALWNAVPRWRAIADSETISFRLRRQALTWAHKSTTFRAIVNEELLTRPLLSFEQHMQQLDFIERRMHFDGLAIGVFPSGEPLPAMPRNRQVMDDVSITESFDDDRLSWDEESAGRHVREMDLFGARCLWGSEAMAALSGARARVRGRHSSKV